MVQVNRWYPHFRTREKQDAGWMALITTAPRVENGTDPAPASPGERTVAAIDPDYTPWQHELELMAAAPELLVALRDLWLASMYGGGVINAGQKERAHALLEKFNEVAVYFGDPTEASDEVRR